MTFSYYLIKPFYCMMWNLKNSGRNRARTAFYCDKELDYEIFRNIRIEDSYYIARNARIKEFLSKKGIASERWPSFPGIVIMARHALHRFPCGSIRKIGLRHGPYHFKKMIDASKYNAFDLFLFTSENEAGLAKALGIGNAVSGGFPKLDSLLNGSIDDSILGGIREELKLDPGKKTLLFSSTWNDSGMSSVEKWYERLGELAERYNIIATVHPFTGCKYKDILRRNANISFVGDNDLYIYMKLSDALISDTSSIIAEYCALYRPIICFDTSEAKRTDPEVRGIIEEISLKVRDFDELKEKVGSELEQPRKRIEAQRRAVGIFFDDDKPDKGLKASRIITRYISSGKSSPNLY